MECGVDKNTFRKYDFEDAYWRDSTSRDYQPEFVFLTDIVVSLRVGNAYMVKDKTTGSFVELTGKSKVLTKLVNEWSGTQTLEDGTQFNFTRGEFERYLNFACPTINDNIKIPLGPQYAVYNNDKRINTFVCNILKADKSKVHDCEELLCLIRESLCDQKDAKSFDEMVKELSDKDGSKEFRFVMHWLAAIYQNPGINHQTNIWFIGQKKGIGKGTLMRVLNKVFGNGFGKASQSDLERGWNNFIEGKLIIEADEFKATSKIDFNAWIKRETTNPQLTINKRSSTPYVVPNISNWIFTTNDTNPIFVEDGDRRNVMIRTTSDDAWKERSIKINQQLDSNFDDVACGFGAVLNDLAVDWDLISRAFDTEMRDHVRAASRNAIEDWVLDGHVPDNKLGGWVQAQDLFDEYEKWREQYARGSRIQGLKPFCQRMNELADRGVVETEKRRHHRFYKIPKDEQDMFGYQKKAKVVPLKENQGNVSGIG